MKYLKLPYIRGVFHARGNGRYESFVGMVLLLLWLKRSLQITSAASSLLSLNCGSWNSGPKKIIKFYQTLSELGLIRTTRTILLPGLIIATHQNNQEGSLLLLL